MRIRLFAIGILAWVVLSPVAAEGYRNAVVLEAFGKSSITATVAYERSLTDRVALGIAVGINNVSRVTFVHDEVNYQATDIAAPLTLYAVAAPIGERHRLIVPAGVVAFTESSFHRYRRWVTATFVPFVGAGYELRGERFAFRAPLYVAYLGESGGIFPAVIPWFGLSVAFSF